MGARAHVLVPHDVIENGRMERPFEIAAAFMVAYPHHGRLATFEAWKHDPQFHADGQFDESLYAEPRCGQIGNPAREPGLAGTTQLHVDQHVAATSYPPRIRSDVMLCDHALLRLYLNHPSILDGNHNKSVNLLVQRKKKGR